MKDRLREPVILLLIALGIAVSLIGAAGVLFVLGLMSAASTRPDDLDFFG